MRWLEAFAVLQSTLPWYMQAGALNAQVQHMPVFCIPEVRQRLANSDAGAIPPVGVVFAGDREQVASFGIWCAALVALL